MKTWPSRIVWLCWFATACFAEEAICQLPRPDYQAKDSDPAWLAAAVQFHGHLGPWAVSGVRLGAAGLKAVDAKGYFDVEVLCEGPFDRPPKSCFLDGLQVGTGATLGKRNLRWTPGEEIVVRVKHTRTGREAVIKPSASLMRLLGSLQTRPRAESQEEDDHAASPPSPRKEHPAEALARRIAALPDDEILVVCPSRPPSSSPPARSGPSTR